MSSTYALHTQWNGGLITASFIVAWLGAATCLQLVKQKNKQLQKYDSNIDLATDNQSKSYHKYNQYIFLLLSGICLGGSCIFAMHFTSMLALSIYDIDPVTNISIQREIRYQTGYTVLSLMLAITVCTFGFYVVDTRSWKRQIAAGIITAAGVLGMHYVGMIAAVMQADMVFNRGIVAVSVIVGIIAATAAFLVFFRFSDLWQTGILMQCITATILAVAVSAVHYTGMFACTYYHTDTPVDLTPYLSSSILISIIIPFSVCSCIGLSIFVVIQYRQSIKNEQKKSKYLRLVALCIEPTTNNILCNFADSLPTVVLDVQYNGKTEFNQNNIDFLRMYKSSFNWSSCQKTHQHICELVRQGKSDQYSAEIYSKFMVAASSMSELLGVTLDNIGQLYWTPNQTQLTLLVNYSQLKARHLKQAGLKFVTQTEFIDTKTLVLVNDIKSDKSNQYSSIINPVIEWLDDVQLYHKRVNMPIIRANHSGHTELNNILKCVAADLLATSDESLINSEISTWRSTLGKYVNTRQHLYQLVQSTVYWQQNTLPPMVKLHIESNLIIQQTSSAVYHQSSTVTLLSLFYIQVTNNGLYVLLHEDGCNYFLPSVQLYRTSDVNGVTVDELKHLRHRIQKEVVLGNSNLVTSPFLLNKHATTSTQRMEHSTTATSQSNNTRSEAVRQSPYHSIELDLLHGMKQLSQLIGGSSNLLLSNLYLDRTINLPDSTIQFLPFVVCNYSKSISTDYVTAGLRAVPLTLFEILHYNKYPLINNSQTKWSRELIYKQLKQYGKNYQMDNTLLEYSVGGTQRAQNEIDMERQILLNDTNDNTTIQIDEHLPISIASSPIHAAQIVPIDANPVLSRSRLSYQNALSPRSTLGSYHALTPAEIIAEAAAHNSALQHKRNRTDSVKRNTYHTLQVNEPISYEPRINTLTNNNNMNYSNDINSISNMSHPHVAG